MVGHPEDVFLDSSEMLKRIRRRPRYDIAIVFVTAALGIAIVWAATLLRPHPPPHYAFIQHGSTIFVADARTGEVAACRLEGGQVRCSESDSAHQAWIRELDAEYPEQ